MTTPSYLRLQMQHPLFDFLSPYTGYLLDTDLAEGGKCATGDTKEMLSYIDVLVDGPFVEKEYSIQSVSPYLKYPFQTNVLP